MGATFVARSFSGDKKQLQTVLKAALSHKGTAVLDVVSPCVTFNDHAGSTKSYKYVRDHKVMLQSIDFVPHFDEIRFEDEFPPGTVREVSLHDGSVLRLEKLEEGVRPDQLADRPGPHRAGSPERPDPDGRSVREHRLAQLHGCP